MILYFLRIETYRLFVSQIEDDIIFTGGNQVHFCRLKFKSYYTHYIDTLNLWHIFFWFQLKTILIFPLKVTSNEIILLTKKFIKTIFNEIFNIIFLKSHYRKIILWLNVRLATSGCGITSLINPSLWQTMGSGGTWQLRWQSITGGCQTAYFQVKAYVN